MRLGLIEHIYGNDYGQSQVYALQRQEKIALKVGSVYHIDNSVRSEADVAGHFLFVVEGGDAVDTWGIDK